ncbi:hypothetical protein [Pectinatus frisingensis]|uniref:hypothetical protein n=1 Tax=Pectinatus frisingensis TaxID=865 RepID=UPI003D809AD1
MADNVHKALDIAGFVPGIGSFSEGANSLLYAFQGEKGEAALAALSAIPGIKAVKVLKDGIQYLKIIPESGEAGKALKELYDVEKTADVAKESSKALVKDTNSISKNTENLRTWAKDNGWVQQNTAGGVEQWGVRNADGTFSWRLKLKPEASTREGLGAGSNQPRFDARLDDKGTYINPFTGETGGRAVGTHIPLGE